MESPGHDDSLVFAPEAKWSDDGPPALAPPNSEPTQADLDEDMAHSGSEHPDVTSGDQLTQLIFQRAADTQVISEPSELLRTPGNSVPIPLVNQPTDTQADVATQTGGGLPASQLHTQPFLQPYLETFPEIFPELSKNSDATAHMSSVQVKGSDSIQGLNGRIHTSQGTQILRALDDTQVILGPSPLRSQNSPVDSPRSQGVVINDQSLPSQWGTYRLPQPTPHLVLSSPEKIVLSSPDAASKHSQRPVTPENMSFASLVGTSDEPKTQVLNTQEELIINDEENSVNLGYRPVYSSSQTDERRLNPDLNINSNDEDEDTDRETTRQIYDDSLFRPKRRRVGVSPKIFSSSSTAASSSFPFANYTNSLGKSWSQSSSELEDVSQDVSGLDLDALTRKSQERAATPPSSEKIADPSILREEPSLSLDAGSVQNPNAVWAFNRFKKFPALVRVAGEKSSLVEFCDNIEVETRNSDLHLLDVRIGDEVSLMTGGEYVVAGLQRVSLDSPFQCIRGFDTLILTKKRRVPNAEYAEFAYPLAGVCMEIEQLAQHQQKFLISVQGANLLVEDYVSVRRLLRLDTKEETKLVERAEKIQIDQKLISPKKPSKSTLLSGMIFFATFLDGPKKEKLESRIRAHGGIFVDDEIKNLLERSPSQSGKHLLASRKLSAFTFGALLSDNYFRSAKYLQALALGWPILADSFVERVIENPRLVENWHVFLLPAGQSLYTDALTNYDTHAFKENQAKGLDLSQQLENKASLLTKYAIVIYNKKQDAKTLDMCNFIFHAFGVGDLIYSKETGEIEEFLEHDDHDNVYVYDNPQGDFLLSQMTRSGRRLPHQRLKNVGVVSWEWVVQCVISGYIWDAEQTVKM